MNRSAWAIAIFSSLILPVTMAHAEWYAAGYGGFSAAQSLKDVTMNNYGQSLAYASYGFTQVNVNLGDSLTQDFKTSNVALKQSPLFGGKAGYFFKDEGFSWLGVELEAYTSTPTIKSQTVSTNQTITYTYNPASRGNVAICPPVKLPGSAPQCSNYEQLNGTLNITESSMRLIVVAFNVVARYPGKFWQPYIGVGAGAFYFNGSGQFNGHQVVPGLNTLAGVKVLATEEWGFFLEGKYNLAQITNFDATYGLSGQYTSYNIVAGIAYHF